jgi:hypothetical protein
MDRSGSVSIVTEYGLGDSGLGPVKGKVHLSSPQRPGLFGDTRSLLPILPMLITRGAIPPPL